MALRLNPVGSIFAIAALTLLATSFNFAQQSATKPELAGRLKVAGDGVKPLDLSAEDFAKLPRTAIKTTNPHTQNP